MAEQGTLCINADVLKKAGANASSTATAEAYTNVYIKEAEGTLCLAAKYDFVTNYSSLSAIGKEALRDGVSCYSAAMAVMYNTSGFISRQDALISLNFLWATWQRLLDRVERDNAFVDFIITGTGGNEDT